jgi:hypothetical protein
MYDNMLYPQLLRMQQQKTFEKVGKDSKFRVILDKELKTIES